VTWIQEAVAAGARQAMACQELGVSARTLQRWTAGGELKVDGRPGAIRPEPANKLSTEERAAVLAAANRPEFASLPPHQIVPRLADDGVYLASESTFYRVLKAADQQQPRGRAKRPSVRTVTTHRADGPNQLWCWDITWLPATVKGKFYYWYMMKDVYSRKLVANEVHACESAELAASLLTRGCLREGMAGQPLVLHSDNGSAMKGATMLATMQNLGVMPSFSRPRVSNDNAHAETVFRTAKYCPLWPEKPFETLGAARAWVQRFVDWYNHEHRHSSLNYVTPAQRHRGEAGKLLSNRKAVYTAARERHPARWSGDIRDWSLAPVVWLNPERAEKEADVLQAA
jgi:transposase InsO family protein